MQQASCLQVCSFIRILSQSCDICFEIAYQDNSTSIASIGKMWGQSPYFLLVAVW